MNILVVDDNTSLARGLSTYLKQVGHIPFLATTVSEAGDLLAKQNFDLIITDLKLPDGEGLEVIRAARNSVNPPEVILMTAFGSVESAVEAMKLGAMDYLTKPVPLEEFAFRIDRVVKLRQTSQRAETLQRARDLLLESAGLASPIDEIVGNSPEIAHVKELIRKVAGFPSTVLLTGETGTGKEMAAHAIHALSPWADGPFVRVNCASIPDTLFESELFGHERGAFTDARERRIGRFESARGGTLFLDEVGEVPLSMQAKLLRALQEKEIVRVGGNVPIQVETRIVAATNRNLDRMTAGGQFRSDLLYRLAVVAISLPPLRSRRGDLPALAEHILQRYRLEFGRPDLRFDPESVEQLQKLPWPGNIRELKNVIERAVVMSEGDVLSGELFQSGSSHAKGPQAPVNLAPDTVAILPGTLTGNPARSLAENLAESLTGNPVGCPTESLTESLTKSLTESPTESLTESPTESLTESLTESPTESPIGSLTEALEHLERSMIERAFQQAGGVKARAAEALQISRTNLIYRMKKLGLMDSGDGHNSNEKD